MDGLVIRYAPLDLELRHVFRVSRGGFAARTNVLVSIREGDRTGLGEASPIRRYGEDPDSALHAVSTMATRLNASRAFSDAAARAAVPGQLSAQAAVDMALHDLAAQRMGVPLFEMLGLDAQRTPQTSFTIGLDTPDVVVEKVRQASAYEILKVKMGSDDDREVLQAVRDSTTQRLRVDANEGWTPQGALERLEWLASIGVEMVEQPLPASRLEDTRRLRRLSPLPFFADESVHCAADIPKLVGAFDGINIKLMKCGGIAEALRMIAVARAHGLEVMLGCMIETSIAITAAAHLSPLADTADLDGNLLLETDPYEGVTVAAGRLVLPDRPGLGVRERKDGG